MLDGLQPPGTEPDIKDCSPSAAMGMTGAPRNFFGATERYSVLFQGRIYKRDDTSACSAGANDALLFAKLVSRNGFDSALTSINGDFALTCFDKKDCVLWVARDRVGVRPLYYAVTRHGVACASRLASLLKLEGISRRANRAFVARFAGLHYRTFDNAPNESPFADVCQLPAAHVIEIRDGKIADIRRYWKLGEAPMFSDPEAELAVAYRELLLDAVECRVRVAHRPAFTLSGGMDSSSVLACAVKSLGQKQSAYSTVYSDPTFDESTEIRSMLDTMVEQWNPVRIDGPDVLRTVARMVSVHDEPVATATWLSHFLLCEKAAGAGVGSLFGGLGGDELNAGEYEYFLLFFADLVTAKRRDLLTTEVDEWIRHHDHPIYRKSRELVDTKLADLVDLERPGVCKPDEARLRRYREAVSSSFYDLASFIPVMEVPFKSFLLNRTFQDLTRETTPCCLRAEDRHTNHFGMENIDPFLDHRLIEFMFRVPGTMKINRGVTKKLLREAMAGVLPEDTRLRVKKTGWNAPAHIWFSGNDLGGVRDIVRSRAFRERGIYDLKVVDKILEEHADIVRERRPVENHMMFIWQLVNLETWFNELCVEL
jgi:asparagine synthase (glutamine-hydrolysing)